MGLKNYIAIKKYSIKINTLAETAINLNNTAVNFLLPTDPFRMYPYKSVNFYTICKEISKHPQASTKEVQTGLNS